MSTLADLQRAFQHHVLSGDPGSVARIEPARGVSAETRLEIYSEAYRLRLRDALASTFPRLQNLLGVAEFDVLARRYIEEFPSHFASIRWFGDRLAESLRRWSAEEPWLGELAEWEWALAAAFDSSDAPVLTADALSRIAADQWPELRFEVHPSLHRLNLRTNAGALFKALSQDDTLEVQPAMLGEPRCWALWRQDSKTHYRSLDASEAQALDAVAAGASFAELCDLLCQWTAPDEVPVRAASLLKRWLADGWIAR